MPDLEYIAVQAFGAFQKGETVPEEDAKASPHCVVARAVQIAPEPEAEHPAE